MSTQHPDNVTLPFFAENSVMGGDDEVQEAYYVFSHLSIGEQMWDSEGKEVDSFVVKKLLSTYGHFFSKRRLGQDVFLTLRVPNPAVEKDEAKVLIETLESIPRSFDAAKKFYGDDIAPIFEVILPMTSSAAELNRVYEYYHRFVVGKQREKVGDVEVREWIGEFKPERVSMVPLIEDKKSMLAVKKIVGDYVEGKRLEHQRVFLARSDPALNYGWLSAVLLNKVALMELDELQEETSVEMLPIIGVGSVPFRGNFRPDNINCLKGYPSVQTFTVQSAFKYDYPAHDVIEAVERVNETRRGKAISVDKKRCSELIERYSAEYTRQLRAVIPWVRKIAKHIPPRRKRKLHVGLFGYSRGVGEFELPRVITFCASLYSLGLPPEVLGLHALAEKDFEFLEQGAYKNFRGDIASALQYANVENIQSVSPDLAKQTKEAIKRFDVTVNEEHCEATAEVMRAVREENHAGMQEKILKAGWVRKFLG